MKDDEPYRQAGDIVRQLFDNIVDTNENDREEMFSGWTHIVGNETTMHVFPTDIIDGVLLLESDHPVWSQKILLEKNQIIRRIREKYPQLGIKNIKVRLSRSEK